MFLHLSVILFAGGRGMNGMEVCMAGGMCGRRDGHCSGRYTSYWNVFLFTMEVILSHWSFSVIHKFVNVGILYYLNLKIKIDMIVSNKRTVLKYNEKCRSRHIVL